MSIEGLIGLVMMLAIGVIGLLMPFFGTKAKTGDAAMRQLQLTRDELIASYERVVATLRDLEEDYNAKKLQPEAYEEERTYWSQYGVRLLQLLDGDKEERQAAFVPQEPDSALDQNVEEAIRNYRAALQSANQA